MQGEKTTVEKQPYEMTQSDYFKSIENNISGLKLQISKVKKQNPHQGGALFNKYEKEKIEPLRNKLNDLSDKWNNVEQHKQAVQQALAEGKQVPPEVLKDYPELKPPKDNGITTAFHITEDIPNNYGEIVFKKGEVLDNGKNTHQFFSKEIEQKLKDNALTNNDFIDLYAEGKIKGGFLENGKFTQEPKGRLITEEAVTKARENISKGKNNRLNSNDIFPKHVKDLTTIGLYHLENKVRRFGDWSNRMIKEVGEWVKPHLNKIWEGIKNWGTSEHFYTGSNSVRRNTLGMLGGTETYAEAFKRYRENPSVENRKLLEEAKKTPREIVKESKPDLVQAERNITERLGKIKDAPLTERLKVRKDETINQIRNTSPKNIISDSINKVKEKTQTLFDKYKSPPNDNDINTTTREWTGAKNIISKSIMDMEESIKKKIPNRETRRAINAYIEANGDVSKLKEWESNAFKRENKNKYRNAQNLTPDQKAVAESIKDYYNEKLQLAIDNGILEEGVKDYVNRKLKKESPETNRMIGEFRNSTLKTNFDSARKRIFDTLFDAEQKGYKSISDDIADNISMYSNGLDNALNNRNYIKNLSYGKASDGRPLIAPIGVNKTEIGTAKDTGFINPHAKGKDVSDYVSLNHPALRKWKWATTVDGNPVFSNVDLGVHPEFAQKLKNVLGESKLKDIPFVKQLKAVQKEIKGLIFTLSPFHIVQEGTHAVGHEINPFGKLLKFDSKNELHKKAVNSGLQLFDYDGMEAISEGLSITNIGRKIPLAPEIQDFTFKKYIPSLKLKTWEKMYESNKERYGKELSDNQIAMLTSDQVNGAYGHMNYKAMFRNPTAQDLFRFVALAPDFLEARAKFVGQAMKPYGRGQLRAIGILAGTMYIGARILNKAINDDMYLTDPRMMFAVKIGDRVWDMRSVPGDVLELVEDPRRFLTNRISPVGRLILETMTSKDWQGRPVDFTETLKDFALTFIPSILKGRQDMTWYDNMLSNFGFRNKKYRTPIESKINEAFWLENPPAKVSDLQKEKSEIFNKIKELKANGKLDEAEKLFTVGQEKGLFHDTKDKTAHEEYQKFLADLDKGEYVNRFKQIKSVETQRELAEQMAYDELNKYFESMSIEVRKEYANKIDSRLLEGYDEEFKKLGEGEYKRDFKPEVMKVYRELNLIRKRKKYLQDKYASGDNSVKDEYNKLSEREDELKETDAYGEIEDFNKEQNEIRKQKLEGLTN